MSPRTPDTTAGAANPLDEAVREIGEFTWNPPSTAHREVASLFGDIDIAQLLTRLKTNLGQTIDPARSVEKTTHYKWFIAENHGHDFEVWLHEYKPKTHRREGHASVPHNHRFWLTSLILKGGFTDTRFRRTPEGPELVQPLDSRAMSRGDTMIIDPDEIHALGELRDGTLSLIVQSRPVRDYSEVFEGGEVRRYSDLGAKLVQLGASL